jgi:hypothetical protein
MVLYTTDAEGNRATSVEDKTDHDAPTILFTGESVALGWGVDQAETYPVLVGRALAVQTVNLGVTGLSSDQAYLRLREALSRFTQPVALVTLVLPLQLERNVNDRRSRLAVRGGRLELVAQSWSPLATSPLRKFFPYHSDEAIELTRAILRATDELARLRGARALFVLTNFGAPCLPDELGTSGLERTLFSGLGVEHVRVDITPALMIHFPKELHPGPKGHEQIANSIIGALRGLPIAHGPPAPSAGP